MAELLLAFPAVGRYALRSERTVTRAGQRGGLPFPERRPAVSLGTDVSQGPSKDVGPRFSCMPARPSPAKIASDLRVPERMMLFCLASGTDRERAYVTHATAQQLLVRGLIDRDPGPARFKLTPLGRDVLAVLLKPPVDEQDG